MPIENKEQDAYLVKRTLAGDDEAFARLVNAYKVQINQFIYRKIALKEDVEDLAQDVFIKAFKSLNKFDQQRNFATWLYTIANNHCIDYLRKKRLKAVSLNVPLFPSDEAKELYLEIPDEEFAPEKVFARTSEQEEVLNAIKSLPEQYSIIIRLRHFKGYSYEEISTFLGLPLGTIKSRIYRARKELKERLFPVKGGKKDGLSGSL